MDKSQIFQVSAVTYDSDNSEFSRDNDLLLIFTLFQYKSIKKKMPKSKGKMMFYNEILMLAIQVIAIILN